MTYDRTEDTRVRPVMVANLVPWIAGAVVSAIALVVVWHFSTLPSLLMLAAIVGLAPLPIRPMFRTGAERAIVRAGDAERREKTVLDKIVCPPCSRYGVVDRAHA